jgi:3'-phosphoadenosine 5'-phosphosulfate sulfotransferase (PAPS reductase)/FAD synthetase
VVFDPGAEVIESHIGGLSGGKDSTVMAVLLQEREPRDYKWVCTPTGRELPEMLAHWDHLEILLGRPLLRLQVGTLEGVIRKQKAIPNPGMRFCTRMLKIEPFEDVLVALAKQGPVTTYVGLRADEPARQGGMYADIPGITMRFPLREWGMGKRDVLDELDRRNIRIPDRTDCDWCFFQRLGEWFTLWLYFPDRFQQGVDIEEEMGYTFRSDSRDTWPAALKDLRREFERGRIPKGWGQGDLLRSAQCRVCSL